MNVDDETGLSRFFSVIRILDNKFKNTTWSESERMSICHVICLHMVLLPLNDSKNGRLEETVIFATKPVIYSGHRKTILSRIEMKMRNKWIILQ